MRISSVRQFVSLKVAFVSALALLGGNVLAKPVPSTCPELVAARSDQFHGNPISNGLSLFMAGNQWVLFDKVLDAYFAQRGGAIDIFTELVPPGFERDQILAGCMTFGAENPHNFNPLTITTQADVFASTNPNLVDDLGGDHALMYKAKPYIRNKLDFLVPQGNPKGIGDGGTTALVMQLLSPDIKVSEEDHINEGIHNAVNGMYKNMDRWVRLNASAAEIAALNDALAAVATPQPGSPAQTRTIEEGIKTNFDLATNPDCHYQNDPDIADGTLRLCEYAILNKSNTHETRVHHVETPNGVRDGSVDTGPLWVSEVKFAKNDPNATVAVDGIGVDDAVNKIATYYIGIMDATINPSHKVEAVNFINFLRSETAQNIYAAGGFIRLTPAELADDSTTRYYNTLPAVSPTSW